MFLSLIVRLIQSLYVMTRSTFLAKLKMLGLKKKIMKFGNHDLLPTFNTNSALEEFGVFVDVQQCKLYSIHKL